MERSGEHEAEGMSEIAEHALRIAGKPSQRGRVIHSAMGRLAPAGRGGSSTPGCHNHWRNGNGGVSLPAD